MPGRSPQPLPAARCAHYMHPPRLAEANARSGREPQSLHVLVPLQLASDPTHVRACRCRWLQGSDIDTVSTKIDTRVPPLGPYIASIASFKGVFNGMPTPKSGVSARLCARAAGGGARVASSDDVHASARSRTHWTTYLRTRAC